MNWVAFTIFIALFAFVTVLGFVASHWRRGDLDLIDEWGLAGRRLGTFITWFLLGGDLYTAYTFVAVPALVFGAGAIGFFALPYTIIVYPFVFVVFPRLWSVSQKHGYVTTSDFVHGRFGSQPLALAVAITGILPPCHTLLSSSWAFRLCSQEWVFQGRVSSAISRLLSHLWFLRPLLIAAGFARLP